MDAKPLPRNPDLQQYKKQAKDLLKGCKSADSGAARAWAERWGATVEPGGSIRTLSDAQFFIAREHGFESWPKFQRHVMAMAREGSLDSRFEDAVDAIISGDTDSLQRLLHQNPRLIRERSSRQHRSNLLHYVAANGIEDFRQKTPRNIVRIAEILLDAGANVNSVSDAYGGSTALSLVATSVHPLRAGVQTELLDLLLKRGATIEVFRNRGSEPIVNICLANGRQESAALLAERGARLDLEGAAGLGRLDLVKGLVQNGERDVVQEQMKSGFHWACEYGRNEVVDFLLASGIDARAKHRGTTAIHWGAHGGHADIVASLLQQGARVDARDDKWKGTPLEWALHGWANLSSRDDRSRYYEVVTALVAAGSPVEPDELTNREVRADRRMLAALKGDTRRRIESEAPPQ